MVPCATAVTKSPPSAPLWAQVNEGAIVIAYISSRVKPQAAAVTTITLFMMQCCLRFLARRWVAAGHKPVIDQPYCESSALDQPGQKHHKGPK